MKINAGRGIARANQKPACRTLAAIASPAVADRRFVPESGRPGLRTPTGRPMGVRMREIGRALGLAPFRAASSRLRQAQSASRAQLFSIDLKWKEIGSPGKESVLPAPHISTHRRSNDTILNPGKRWLSRKSSASPVVCRTGWRAVSSGDRSLDCRQLVIGARATGSRSGQRPASLNRLLSIDGFLFSRQNKLLWL